MCTERRKNIWECVLVKIFCWRYYVSNLSIFKKLLQYFIAVREQQRVRLSHYRVFGRENQELTDLFFCGLLVGDWITSCTPDLWYMQISRRIGIIAPTFSIYNFSSRVILKSGLPSQIAAEYVLKVEIK